MVVETSGGQQAVTLPSLQSTCRPAPGGQSRLSGPDSSGLTLAFAVGQPASCTKGRQQRSRLAQGFHATGWRALLLLGLSAAAAQAAGPCPGPALDWQAVETRDGAQLLWLPAAAGDANAVNRGRILNQWLLREPARGDQPERVWLMGSGPTPAAAAALDCQLQARLGWRVTDVINPWARPEAVLGNTGWPAARHWAHADVAARMASTCGQCEAGLRNRLGAAASDLGPAPIALPEQLLQGDGGRLGPWDWWRFWRNETVATTVWHWRGSGVWLAPGLLWAEGPPDLREADTSQLAGAWACLPQLVAQATEAGANRSSTTETRWGPEQGPWMGADGPAQQQAYVDALQAAIRALQAAAAPEAAPAARLPGRPDWQQTTPRHSLNWQRQWRRLDDEGMTESATAPQAAPLRAPTQGACQRNLR